MRSKDESKFVVIADEMKRFFAEKGRMPSQKEISLVVGLGKTAVHRYMKAMRERGLIEGYGREVSTKETQLIPIPMLDTLRDGSRTYDSASINDIFFVSRKIFGAGKICMVRAVDDSMSGVNIRYNSFIMVRRQKDADIGEIVLVKALDRFFLRRLIYDEESKTKRLVSESKTFYAELIKYEIRGVVISVIEHLDNKIIQRCLQQLIQ